jgi:hypothetical protein
MKNGKERYEYHWYIIANPSYTKKISDVAKFFVRQK